MITVSSSRASLTSCQTKALDILVREGNVFLTGAAGTGKSFLLSRYLADKPTDAFPVVASTGVAAVIVGGRTFHSFFGLGILEGGTEAAVARALRNTKVIRRLERACCVIIDEVSMLPGTVLRAAETVARSARRRDQPWGGLRIITVGDFAQLPPVTPDQHSKDWAFLHPVWEETGLTPALLSTVMRTQDSEFLGILNFVREGILNDRVEAFLRTHTIASPDESMESTRLYPHRAQAEEHNLKRLSSIQKPLRTFVTEYSGQEQYLEAAKRAMPIPDTLLLKEGALVMMRRNDPTGALQWVNGSLGHVTGIANDTLFIHLLSGDHIEIEREEFSYLDGDGNTVVSAINFPVTLAWATTIHKAQGASLDRMIVDLHALWEPGQAYVALSRVRSADGLSIARWSPSSIRAEPLVTAFYDALADQTKKYVPRPFFVPPERSQDEKPHRKRRGHTSKERIEKTRVLLEQGKDLTAIAEACEVTEGTVIKYIEKLIEKHSAPCLTHLISHLPRIDDIRSLYHEHGTEHMKPIFDALNGEVSYDHLRLVQLVMTAEEKVDR